MTGASKTSNAKRLVLMVWILVAIFYFYLSYDYIRIARSDDKFAEYLDHVVQLGAGDNRQPKELRALLLVKADELDLPIRGDQITIQGSGTKLSISVGYDIDIDVPVINRGVYTKHFDHKAVYKMQ